MRANPTLRNTFLTTLAASLLLPATLLAAETPSTASAAPASSSLRAAQATSTVPPVHRKAGPPKVEIFVGYSYLRAIPTYADGNRLVWLNGGSASIAFNLNRYLGIVGDFGGFADSQLNLTGPGIATPHVAASGGNAYTFLGGPRLSFRGDRLTPFAQALFGGIHASPVTLNSCSVANIGTGTAATCTPLPSQNAFAFTAGGGLDLRLTHRFSLRLAQAEYLMTRFPNPNPVYDLDYKTTQNDIRLSSGLLIGLGGGPAPLPVAYSCAVAPASAYPGDPLTVTGTALYLNPKRQPTYTWKTDGGHITGTTATATIDTANLAPGAYTAQGHVSESLKPGHFADCAAPYTILAFQPPTLTCSANPSTVRPGDSATITALGVSPQGRPLTYSYAATAGSIAGTSTTATLNTTGAASGTLQVTCNTIDDKGQSATATTTVTIDMPPAPPVIATQQLCTIDFARDHKRPVRVDNEAKACLDDVALNLQRTSDAQLALIGHSDTNPDAASRRALNARTYLTTDKGISPDRILLYTGPSTSKTVEIILIPAGAKLPLDTLTPVTTQP